MSRAAVSGIGSEAGSLESEDCLNLTVYTPGTDSAHRPVMVWFHGGGFAGSGSNPMYEGSALAVHGDVVVVNVNHRLNVLGYAHLPGGGEEFASSGNVGILDLELALRWVRDNIERFGGDAKRVLISASPAAARRRRCCGPCPRRAACSIALRSRVARMRRLRSAEDGAAVGERLLKQLGLEPDAGARAAAVAAVAADGGEFRPGQAARRSPASPRGFEPVFDNRVVTRHPFDPIANPLNADVPLIIGTTRTENTVFMMGDAEAFRLDLAGLKAAMRALLGERAGDAAVALYPGLKPLTAPSELYFEMLSDRTRRQSILIAEMKAAQNEAKAYLYELMWDTPVMDGLLRSPHSLCMPDGVRHRHRRALEALHGRRPGRGPRRQGHERRLGRVRAHWRPRHHGAALAGLLAAAPRRHDVRRGQHPRHGRFPRDAAVLG